MMKRKQRFSLRKNKIGTASVLLGLTIVGGASYATTQAQAADVPVETTAKQDKVYTVTDEQVLDAKKNVDDKKVEIDSKTKEVDDNKKEITNAQNEKNELEKKADSLVNDIDEAKKITPDIINVVKNDIKKAETDKATNEQEFNQAQRDKAAKLNAKNTADEKVKDAQKEADEADKNMDLKKKAFDPAQKDIAKKKLTEAEKIVNEKQKQKDNAQKELDDAKEHDRKLAESKVGANIDLNMKKEEKATKYGEIADARRRLQDIDSDLEKDKYPFGIKGIKMNASLDSRFVSELKEYFELRTREAREAKMQELIKIEKEILSKRRSKLSSDLDYKDDEKIDIRNLSEEDNIMFSQYVAMLNNQIRAQFGKPAQKVNLNVQRFIREASKITMDEDFNKIEHHHKALNTAAFHAGIDKYNHGNTYNRFESLTYIPVKITDNRYISRRYLFDQLHDSLLGFYYEAHMTGHYGHAKHLLSDDDTMAVGFAITSYPSYAILNLDQLRISIASINKYSHHDREIWKEKFSANSKDTLELIHISTEAEIREKEKNLDIANKALNDAQKALDVATRNVTDAHAKLDDLNKIKEKTQDAQNRFNKAAKDLQDAEKEKQKAEENLRNVTADQDSKQKALNDALNVQKQKYDELNKVKDDANRAQKEYDDALKACKDKHEDLNKILDKIQYLTKKKKDMEDKVAKLEENEKELVKVKAQLQDEVNKLTNLLQTQTKLSDQLQKLMSELKDLEKEYNRLLQIYTNESMQEPPINPKPFIDIKEEVKEEELDYKTLEKNDSTLEEGKRIIKVKGKKGRKSIKTITLSENGKVLDVVTQETILQDAVDEVVLVGTKHPDVPGEPGKESNKDQTPGKEQDSGKKQTPGKLGNVAPDELNNKPELQRPRINSNELNTLPNTGENQTGTATVAGLVALAVAARLRKRVKEN